MSRPCSRRQFIKHLSLASVGALAGCAAAAPATVTPAGGPERVLVTREVEVTRVIERVVEITRVAPRATATPLPEPPIPERVWYVDIEHERVLEDPAQARGHEQLNIDRAGMISIASTLLCDAIHYRAVDRDLTAERKVRAIAISGNVTDWDQYDMAAFQPLFELIRDGRLPVIGLCGGHQLLGLLFGAECGPLRKLRPGEADPDPSFAPGYYKEVGYKPVRVVSPDGQAPDRQAPDRQAPDRQAPDRQAPDGQGPDPLFAGLSATPVFFQSHYWEVKAPPEGFVLLASTDDCRVQAMRHEEWPIYGTQFHPEVNSVAESDGLTLLENFFRHAGIRKI